MVDDSRTTLRATLRGLVHVHGADVVRAELELVSKSGPRRRPTPNELAVVEPARTASSSSGEDE